MFPDFHEVQDEGSSPTSTRSEQPPYEEKVAITLRRDEPFTKVELLTRRPVF